MPLRHSEGWILPKLHDIEDRRSKKPAKGLDRIVAVLLRRMPLGAKLNKGAGKEQRVRRAMASPYVTAEL